MVSVILPNYNHAPYLAQRIETVLFQTYRNFELIILDDCSTDGSRDIIERYRGHEKVTGIFYNEINSGSTFRQWEKGIALCKGEFIWIAESDDWCECTFIEEVLTGLDAAKDCVVGYCQSYCVLGANKIKWQSSYDFIHAVEEGPDFIKKHMLTGNAIFNASMAIWRKDTFALISKEFVQYRFCGDWLFWIELCRHGRVSISGKLLNYFRKHDGDVSGKAMQNGLNFIEELKMFRLLHARQWITHDELAIKLKSGYVHYRAVHQQLTQERKKEISSLFFAEKGSGTALRLFYTGFYTKHIIKKVFNRLMR